MSRLPTTRKHDIISRNIENYYRRRHPYLPIKLMEWRDPEDETLLAHPAENIVYEVRRRTGKYSCYWACAVLQKNTDPIVLGEEFLCKEEAVEICEAYEYARLQAQGTIVNVDQKKLT